jgi:FkbM family methyltransferase
MSTYLENIFTDNINKNDIKIIFELGSRDLIDGNELQKYYNCIVYSFECNPDCIIECNKNKEIFNNDKLILVPKAISIENKIIDFYPFDLSKYDNIGASSILEIDFSKRDINDADYNRENPQIKINVEGIRLDTFIDNKIKVDMLCIDLQGYELNAIKSLGDELNNVKYIIVETSINSVYKNGTRFEELNNYLINYNFEYICSDTYGYNKINLTSKSSNDFNALFINKNL